MKGGWKGKGKRTQGRGKTKRGVMKDWCRKCEKNKQGCEREKRERQEGKKKKTEEKRKGNEREIIKGRDGKEIWMGKEDK